MRHPLQFSYYYVGADLFLIALSLGMGGLWLINTQVAFIASMLITYATYYAYKRMVERRVKKGEWTSDEREELEKIDDPYRLYEEEEDVRDDLPMDEFKELIKEEKKKIGGFKQSGKNLFTSIDGFFSPYRLLSYLFLCGAFLYLNRHGWFDAIPFFVGLAVVPVTSTLMSFKLR